MTYTFWSTTSDTITAEEFNRLADFIKRETTASTEPAAANMGSDSTAGFLYNIKNQLRWRSDTGAIYIAEYRGDIAAVSCVEYSENTRTWAIGGIRTWISPAHRIQKLPSQFLEQQAEWAQAHDCNFMLVTFNDYNRALHTAVHRGLYRVGLGWSMWWADCLAVAKQVTIRYTPQWCVIKPIHCRDNQVNLKELIAWAQLK